MKKNFIIICLILSFLLGLAFFKIVTYHGWTTNLGTSLSGGIFAYIFGVFKELYDVKVQNTNADPDDIRSYAIGSLLGALLFFIISFI